MKLNIKLFGPQAQTAGARAVQVEIDSAQPDIKQVRQALLKSAPQLADSLSVSRLAVNHEFAPEDKKITENDEIALIGLVSGG